MRKVTIVTFFVFLMLSASAVSSTPPDTAFWYNDKKIIVNERNRELSISVYNVNESGDTIRSEKIYEGVFTQDRIVEREYDNRFEISIPEVFRPKKRRYFDPHWSGFGVGFTHLPEQMNFDGELSSIINSGTSLQYNLNFAEATYRIGLDNVRIVLGMGLQFNSVHLQTNKAIEIVDYKAVVTTTESGYDYNTSRLHFTCLTLPLLLEYNSPSSAAGFFINGGIVGKIKTASSSKVWFNEDGKKKKLKMPGELNIRPVNLDFLIQAGFGEYGLFASYAPFDLFMKHKGPKGNQVSVGLQYYF